LTTGGSLRETLAALASHPVYIAGVAVLVDRSGGEVDLGVPYIALATMDIATWDASDCPLCRRGESVVKPGTTAREGAG
jgi:orotate phosphoribosyltransferase